MLEEFCKVFEIQSSHADNTARCLEQAFHTAANNASNNREKEISNIYHYISKIIENDGDNCSISNKEAQLLQYLIEDVKNLAAERKDLMFLVAKAIEKGKATGKIKTNPLNTNQLPDPLRPAKNEKPKYTKKSKKPKKRGRKKRINDEQNKSDE